MKTFPVEIDKWKNFFDQRKNESITGGWK